MRLQHHLSSPNSLKAVSELSPFSMYSKYGLKAWAINFPHEKQRIGIMMIHLLLWVNFLYVFYCFGNYNSKNMLNPNYQVIH